MNSPTVCYRVSRDGRDIDGHYTSKESSFHRYSVVFPRTEYGRKSNRSLEDGMKENQTNSVGKSAVPSQTI